jgi:hypothetical protein
MKLTSRRVAGGYARNVYVTVYDFVTARQYVYMTGGTDFGKTYMYRHCTTA